MNTTKPDKEKTLAKIQFLEARLVTLDFYLPDTYQFLLEELDIQRRILAKLEVEEHFNQIDDNELPNGNTSA